MVFQKAALRWHVFCRACQEGQGERVVGIWAHDQARAGRLRARCADTSTPGQPRTYTRNHIAYQSPEVA